MKIACSLFLSSLLVLQAAAQDVPNAPDNIGGLCTGIDFCVGAAACALACEPAACCHPGVDDNCLVTDLMACTTYLPCGIFVGWGPLVCASEDIAVCDEDLSVEANLDACALACEPSACCGPAAEDSCLLSDGMACATYASCANLLLADLPVAPTEVDEFCTQDLSVEANLEACATACAPATCCSPAAEDSCFATDLIACATYGNCANIPGSGTPVPVPAPTASLAPSKYDDSSAAFEGFGFAALVALSLLFVNV